MTNINKAFNPEVSYGGYMIVEGALYEAALAGSKGELALQMEAFVPPEFRQYVTWFCTPPSLAMHGTVAWKYSPVARRREAEAAEAMKSARAEMAAAIEAEASTQKTISRLSDSLARGTDDRIAAILKRRLLADVIDWRSLKGRLGRVVTQGTGYETYLLDGRPFARVYAPALIQKPSVIAFDQVVEELSGE